MAAADHIDDDRSSLESTLEVCQRARAGSREDLEELYRRCLPRLSRWASGRISASSRHLQDTGDIVQDVLHHFLSKLEDFNPRHEGALMVYLHTAVMNRIRDQARRAKRRGSQVDVQDAPLDSGAPSPYEQCVAEETRTRYRRALLALSEEERCAVILKLELDYKPTDLARALNKDTPDAARVYTKRAIMKLAREMGRG